ncbi:MAG: peptidase M3, partial [Calditrichaeota bacterium]|nr:peptidase M3 [Calditrichota bacterium]
MPKIFNMSNLPTENQQQEPFKMRTSFLLFFTAAILLWSCSMIKKEPLKDQNPFFIEYITPFDVPPFDKIEGKHYLPAFKEGMKQERNEIEVIASRSEVPTFENTIEAMEGSGALLTRVSDTFFNLTSAHTNDELQNIAKKVTPLLSRHRDDIMLNEKLFQRVRAVYEQKDRLNLAVEQNTLLEEYYRDFVRGGANLDEEQKAELREINEELSLLTLKFGENILGENNAFELVIEKEADLAGLPEAAIIGAAEAAGERGHEGKWVFTLHKPSMIPFLQYSERRDLR